MPDEKFYREVADALDENDRANRELVAAEERAARAETKLRDARANLKFQVELETERFRETVDA